MIKARLQTASKRTVGLLARLFLVLLITLFGVHHASTERPAAQYGPVAVIETAFVPVNLTAQSHLLRAPIPEGDPPQATAPAPEMHMPLPTMTRVSWDYVASVPTPVIPILPPARGPPTV
jgi:hypothetical protein